LSCRLIDVFLYNQRSTGEEPIECSRAHFQDFGQLIYLYHRLDPDLANKLAQQAVAHGDRVASAQKKSPPPERTPATGSCGYLMTGAADTLSTATLLQDGRVLVTGYDESQNPNSNEWEYTPLAELYGPNTGTFSVTGAPIDDCLSDSAKLLDDGRVLFVACGDGGACRLLDEIRRVEIGLSCGKADNVFSLRLHFLRKPRYGEGRGGFNF